MVQASTNEIMYKVCKDNNQQSEMIAKKSERHMKAGEKLVYKRQESADVLKRRQQQQAQTKLRKTIR